MNVLFSHLLNVQRMPRTRFLEKGSEVGLAWEQEVSGVALLASKGEFELIAYMDGVEVWSGSIEVDGDVLVPVPDVDADRWQIAAVRDSFLTAFYPGCLVHLTNPDVPFTFGRVVSGVVNKTIGGAVYSSVDSSRRQGSWGIGNIPLAELPGWRQLVDATKGGRQSFVVEVPDHVEPTLVQAVGLAEPVLQDVVREVCAGQMTVSEVV
ncbi:hypothetical protein [Aliamphritea hakodatensis]|uniref:hypothetical protein n=1 Tax=Aliamphritea hakodatensis TaxID=2895352 RepID=UPI0022FD4A9D|nr:hypothetical protein [Aliamphritea hakodatensis]